MYLGEKTELKKIFNLAYLYLLVDQHDSGLWGKSIHEELKGELSSKNEVKADKKRGNIESITSTQAAIEGIYSFTKDPMNPAITRARKELTMHQDSGAYGNSSGHASTLPLKLKIQKSSRHTATALLAELLFRKDIDENLRQTVLFLVEHQNMDGGWGIEADPKSKDSDCISTGYVLGALSMVKSLKKNNFTKKEMSDLDKKIKTGVIWLEKDYSKNGNWVYEHKKEGITYHKICSANTLTYFPQLKSYNEKLYNEALNYLLSLQNEDGGWSESTTEFPKNKSGLRDTIWSVNALISSGGKKLYLKQILNGMEYIKKNISNPQQTKKMTGVEWAMLLKLSGYSNIVISEKEDFDIRKIADKIEQEVISCSDIGYLNKVLPKKYITIKEPLEGMLQTYISFDKTPHIWKKTKTRRPRIRKAVDFISGFKEPFEALNIPFSMIGWLLLIAAFLVYIWPYLQTYIWPIITSIAMSLANLLAT